MNAAQSIALAEVHVRKAKPAAPNPRRFIPQPNENAVLVLFSLSIVIIEVVHHREGERRVINWLHRSIQRVVEVV